MTLGTHALVGAAVAQLFPGQPAIAFAAAFASHIAIDSLPHWDYKIFSLERAKDGSFNHDMRYGKTFLLDLSRMAFDAMLGTALAVGIFAFWLGTATPWLAFAGAVAGILPDPLQFVYWKTRCRLLLPLQRFHVWVQEGMSLYIPAWKGLARQAALVAVVSAVSVLARIYLIK